MKLTLGIADNDRDGVELPLTGLLAAKFGRVIRHRRRIGIAEPHGASSPWVERAADHRKVPNRRARP